MRYLASPLLEAYESATLPTTVGRRYDPLGPVSVHGGSVLNRAPGAVTELLDGDLLGICPDTASWAFLDPIEHAIWTSLDSGLSSDEVRAAWSTRIDDAPLADILAGLYRRALVTVDGQGSLDPAILHDGHNTRETHLVELLVTEKCNLGCVYCLAGTSARMPKMTLATALRAVDLAFAMEEAEQLAFELSGGEPFLEFDLMKAVVARIRELQRSDGRPVSINVQSNATLFNQERVAWVLDNDINLGISFDGTPSSQDRSRPLLGGKGSFDQVQDGIDLLQRNRVPFGALVVLNRYNIDDTRELADFLVENGVVGFKLNAVAFLGTARYAWQEIGVTQEEVMRFTTELMHLVADEGYPLVESNVRAMCEHLVSKRRTTRCMRGHCGAGDSFQAISASGDIYACGRATQSEGLKLGHVNDTIGSLSEPARKSLVIAEIRQRRPETLDGCVTCSYRQLCQAGCSAQAWERYGTVRHRTPECHYFKTSYPWLMHWLSFDPRAADTLGALTYFGDGGVRAVSTGSHAQTLAA